MDDGGNGFGRVRDLTRDFDDVAFSSMHPELAIRRGATSENREDPFELALGAELARMRSQLAHRAPDEPRDRDSVSASGREIHHRRLEPVPCCEPLVLAREDAVVRRDLVTGLVPLAKLLHECLAVRRDRHGVLHTGDRVADPDLDRPEPRM